MQKKLFILTLNLISFCMLHKARTTQKENKVRELKQVITFFNKPKIQEEFFCFHIRIYSLKN